MFIQRKAASVFVFLVAAILLVCTFAARPIQALTTPIVTTAVVRNQRMEYKETKDASLWYTDQWNTVSLPFRLDSSLTMTKLYVSRLDMVEVGDPLVAFDAMGGEYLYKQAQKSLLSAQISYDSTLSQQKERMLALQSEIAQAAERSSGLSGKEQSEQLAAIARAKAELQDLEQGKNDSLKLQQILLAEEQEKLTALARLRDDGWVLKSPCEGFVAELDASIGGSYGGLEALCTLCGASDALTLLVPIDDRWLNVIGNYGVRATVEKRDTRFEAEVVGTETRPDASYLRLRFTGEDVWTLLGSCKVQLSSMSAGSSCLVPAKALMEGSVFLLQERDGYFGKEYYVEQKSILVGEKNDDYVEALSGLYSGQRIVVEADREIVDGDVVMYPIG